MKTKSSSTCPILGSLFPLHETQLPTSEDVLRHYYYLREFSVTPATIRKTSLFTDVYKAVCAVYRKASFPTLSLTERRIIEKMKILNTSRDRVMKRKDAAKISAFKKDLQKLFIVTHTITPSEADFYKDQLTTRQLYISNSVDLATSSQHVAQQRKDLRKAKACSRLVNRAPQPFLSVPLTLSSGSDSTASRSPPSSPAYQPPPSPKTPKYNTTNLDTVVEVLASSGVTPGQASKVITAYNICKRKADSPLEVVTRGKLRTQSEKRRKTAMTDLKRSCVNGLYFDGRNDKTLTKSTYFSSATTITKKGHYSLVSQPDDNYIGFCTPPSGTGRNIAEAIISYLTDKEIDLNDIIVLGCDGTAANTGWKGGAMAHLESLLGKA